MDSYLFSKDASEPFCNIAKFLKFTEIFQEIKRQWLEHLLDNGLTWLVTFEPQRFNHSAKLGGKWVNLGPSFRSTIK